MTTVGVPAVSVVPAAAIPVVAVAGIPVMDKMRGLELHTPSVAAAIMAGAMIVVSPSFIPAAPATSIAVICFRRQR